MRERGPSLVGCLRGVSRLRGVTGLRSAARLRGGNRLRGGGAWLTAIVGLSFVGLPPRADELDVYTSTIKPLIRERCYACHASLAQEAGLRLDTVVAMRQGGDSGPVVAAAGSASLLIERILATDPAERMPPEGEPLSNDQIATIIRWIDQGAPSPPDETPEADPRDHWAFIPPRRPELPVTADTPAHPIDRFIDHRLAAAGLRARPEASRQHRLRRVFLDLIGVPPTPEELAAFVADASPAAWEHAVDRLLDDPRYGQRWARHWMDIWRYADWYGRRHVPDVWNSAPQVWRWRDWIVDSLNADLGYDRMLTAMLAADEVFPESREQGYATGYLVRNWYALNPNDWMRATVEHTGKAFLGLTFNCAHCHDHKYDPISQEDYFRLRAFFEPIGIRQDRVPGEADPGPFQEYEYSSLRKVQPLGSVRIFDRVPDAPTWFYAGGDERNRVTERGSLAPGLPEALLDGPLVIEPIALPPVAWYPALEPALQETLLDEAAAAVAAARAAVLAAAAAAGEPTAESLSRQFARQEAAARLVAAVADAVSLQARIMAANLQHATGREPERVVAARDAVAAERQAAVARAAADMASASLAEHAASQLPADAEHREETRASAAATLAAAVARHAEASALVTADNTGSFTPLGPTYPPTSTGRRAALAAWITRPDNPLTARVAVNHVWNWHFHAPLVQTVNDFGRSATPPSHPDLLDWLAVEFVEHGWSMKHLHRLILTSQAYRRDTAIGDSTDSYAIDPDNRLLWRMNTGRMQAEVVRDSLLAVAGLLDVTPGGPPLPTTDALTSRRRSLYQECYPEDGGASSFAMLFDPPDPLDCYRRTRSIVPQQALALTNSPLAHELAATIAGSFTHATPSPGGTAADSRDDDAAFLEAMFLRILSRPATDAEEAICLEALQAQTRQMVADGATAPAASARESLVRALLNHNDFITIR